MEEVYQAIGIIFAMALITLAKHWADILHKKKLQPIKKEASDRDFEMHQNIAISMDSINTNMEKSNVLWMRIEKVLSVTANKYTRELPISLVKENAERVFQLARREIYLGILDLINEKRNWTNKHVQEKTYNQIGNLITNIFNQDVNYMKEFTYDGKCLDQLMNEKWKDSVIGTCKKFVSDHYVHGNGFGVFNKNLRSEFEKIYNEFINKL